MITRKLLKTVSFPAQSKPHMLRVSPDGKEVWVQTADANTNVVLSADDLSVLATEPTGKSPVTNAWTPDRRYSIVTNGQDTFAQIFDARTFKEVKRLTIGLGGTNVGFSKDGKTAFIAVTGANAVAVIDAEKLCADRPDQGGPAASGPDRPLTDCLERLWGDSVHLAPRPLRGVGRSGEHRSISASSSASIVPRLLFGLRVPVSVRLRCRRQRSTGFLTDLAPSTTLGPGMTSGLKICSLLPSATEIVFALGRGDNLVAVTHECDFPPEAARLPIITKSTLDHRTQGSREIHNHISSAVHAGSSIYALDQDLLDRLALISS